MGSNFGFVAMINLKLIQNLVIPRTLRTHRPSSTKVDGVPRTPDAGKAGRAGLFFPLQREKKGRKRGQHQNGSGDHCSESNNIKEEGSRVEHGQFVKSGCWHQGLIKGSGVRG